MMWRTMLTKKAFDNLIKTNLSEKIGAEKFGYELSKNYEDYYNKAEFNRFLEEMKQNYPTAYERYADGKGSELREKPGRYGMYPPKMASVASSSRFCYLALRDGGEALGDNGIVLFEYGCPIQGVMGNAPQLDAYLPESNTYIEAKCHEIFDSHSIVLKEKYWDFMFGEQNDFGFSQKEYNGQETFQIAPAQFGIQKENTMFDIKQFLCHLLGIASENSGDKPAKLVYLFFKPKTEDEATKRLIDDVFGELRKEIHALFFSKSIQRFIQKNKIHLDAIVEESFVMEHLTTGNFTSLVNQKKEL